MLVGFAAGDLEQILQAFVFAIILDRRTQRKFVHATKVARVARVSTAIGFQSRFEDRNAGACPGGSHRGADCSVSAPNRSYIVSFLLGGHILYTY